MSVLTKIASATVGPILPWAIAAWLASLAGAGLIAHHAGVSGEKTACSLAKAEAETAAVTLWGKEITKALQVGADIADGLVKIASRKAESATKNHAIAAEVSHATAQSSLATVAVPDRVLQLRNEQADESAAIAATAGDLVRARFGAHAGAGATHVDDSGQHH